MCLYMQFKVKINYILNWDIMSRKKLVTDQEFLNDDLYGSIINILTIAPNFNTQDQNNKNSPHPKPMYHGTTKKERKLHEVLIKFYYAFKGYWDLKEYAGKKNVEIVNLTANSYIDAFNKEDI